MGFLDAMGVFYLLAAGRWQARRAARWRVDPLASGAWRHRSSWQSNRADRSASRAIAAQDDDPGFVLDHLHQAVGAVDATRPSRRQAVFERLLLADAGRGIALRILDQIMHALEGFYSFATDFKRSCPTLQP